MNQNYIKPLDKIVSIKIERKLPPLLLGILYILCDIVLSCALLISTERISGIILISIYNLILIGVFFFYVINQNKQPPYLSHIELTSMDLALIYKKGKSIVNTEVIPLADIQSFNAVFNCSLITHRKAPTTIFVCTEVEIKASDKETSFVKETSFEFVKDLLKYAVYLPNFSYELKGNCFKEKPYLKRELEYLALHGKNTPFFDKIMNLIMYSTLEEKIMFFLISVICFISVLCLIYFIKTNFFA